MRTSPLLPAFMLLPISLLLLGNESCSEGDNYAGGFGEDDDWTEVSTGGGAYWGDEDGSGNPEASLSDLAGICSPVSFLTCGDVVSGDSNSPNSGATETMDFYPVGVGNYTGPEVTWAFTATATEEVVWRLRDPQPTEVNHDLFVLEGGGGTCSGENAVGSGFNELRFHALEGETYFLVLDGYAGDAGWFEAELDCLGVVPTDGHDAGGASLPEGPSSCDSLWGHWDSDPLDVIARCDTVLQHAIADSGWLGTTEPTSALLDADLCLARGTWGYNDRDYFVLGGRLLADVTYGSPTARNEHFIVFEGEDGGSHGLESGGGIDLLSEDLGGLVVENGDWETRVRYDNNNETLLYRQEFNPWGPGGDELIHSALIQCTGL